MRPFFRQTILTKNILQGKGRIFLALLPPDLLLNTQTVVIQIQNHQVEPLVQFNLKSHKKELPTYYIIANLRKCRV